MSLKLSLAFVGAVGLAGTAFAQTAPGDPAGNQTIPEKDQSGRATPRTASRRAARQGRAPA
jgi:hypothetical protein